jgi:hypothetical protein
MAMANGVEALFSREMTGRTQTLPWWLGRMGKDDRKQNTLAALFRTLYTVKNAVKLLGAFRPDVEKIQYH